MNQCRTYHQPGVLRVLQTKEETKAFYDKIAKVYDVLAERSEAPVRMAGLKMLNIQLNGLAFAKGKNLLVNCRMILP